MELTMTITNIYQVERYKAISIYFSIGELDYVCIVNNEGPIYYPNYIAHKFEDYGDCPYCEGEYWMCTKTAAHINQLFLQLIEDKKIRLFWITHEYMLKTSAAKE